MSNVNVHVGLNCSVHGLTSSELDNAHVMGERIKWSYAGPPFCKKHIAWAHGIEGYGATRHSALNNLIGKLQATKQKEPDMAMSKDRVSFHLPAYLFSAAGLTSVLEHAFNVDATTFRRMRAIAETNGAVEIICRPSQFARFLIYREQAGFQNMFKELKAKLFTPEPELPKNIDVSSNPA